MAVIDINDTNFEEALAGAEAAIVDFYAAWCGPCFMFAPTYGDLSEEYGHVTFFKLDGEASPKARKSVKIPGLPFFGVYRRGELIEGIATSKEDRVRELLDKHFGPAGGDR